MPSSRNFVLIYSTNSRYYTPAVLFLLLCPVRSVRRLSVFRRIVIYWTPSTAPKKPYGPGVSSLVLYYYFYHYCRTPRLFHVHTETPHLDDVCDATHDLYIHDPCHLMNTFLVRFGSGDTQAHSGSTSLDFSSFCKPPKKGKKNVASVTTLCRVQVYTSVAIISPPPRSKHTKAYTSSLK